MANVPPNDPNVDAPANVHAPANPEHAPAQPVGLENGFHPWEVDDEAEVIEPYTGDDLNNPPPPISEDEETPPTSPVIPDADGQPIPPIASFGQNFHFSDSLSTVNLLTGNSKFVSTGPMCLNLGTVWRKMKDMEKFMMERIDTEGRMKKKFKKQDHHFVGLGCDNIEKNRKVRKDANLSYEEVIKGLVIDSMSMKGAKFSEIIKFWRRNGLPVPSGSQVKKPPAEPFARSTPALCYDNPYVVARDAAAAVTTSDIDDDDDTASIDSQPYESRGSPRDSQ
ncbi:hypothetical protein Tco_1554123 [Tanacetum coccineum]